MKRRYVTVVIFIDESGDASCYAYAGRLTDARARRRAFDDFLRDAKWEEEVEFGDNDDLIEDTFNIRIQRTTIRPPPRRRR